MMKVLVVGVLLLVVTAQHGHAAEGESMLNYFKGRLPATTPPGITDALPIMQGNGAAIRMIRPSDLGIVGPAGPQGETGPGLDRFRGEWDPGATYQQYDIVTYGGNTYLCTTPGGC